MVPELNQCPTCRQKYKHNQHVKNDRNTRNLISLLLFKCVDENCDVIVPLKDLEKHRNICLFERITCDVCQMKICRSHNEIHKEKCELHKNLKNRDLELKSIKTELKEKKTELQLIKNKLNQAGKEQKTQEWLKVLK